MTDQIIRDANQLTSQRLISHYLPSPEGENVWMHSGACLTARRIPNRYGVPPDATTWRYVVRHPDFGWSYVTRAVWRSDKLMPPLATHVTVEAYFNDDEKKLLDEASVVVAINEWLCSL